MATKGRYYLLWEFAGEVRGRRFRTWKQCEAFSKRLLAAGLAPWLSPDSPCPYDNTQ